MKAWTENNTVRDVCNGDPNTTFHPDIAKLYITTVPDGTQIGATLINGTWNNPAPPVYIEPVAPEPIPEKRHITKLAFRNRFTITEKVAIEIAQLDDLTATMEVRSFKAALRASQTDVNVSTYIDLDKQETIAGVNQLEAAGLIGVGRANEILTNAITEEEKKPV